MMRYVQRYFAVLTLFITADRSRGAQFFCDRPRATLPSLMRPAFR